MPEKWVDAAAVGEHLGLSATVVVRRAVAKDIPGRKIGPSWRFRITDVDAYLTRPVDVLQQSAQSRARKRA